jgi:hypothetical protein
VTTGPIGPVRGSSFSRSTEIAARKIQIQTQSAGRRRGSGTAAPRAAKSLPKGSSAAAWRTPGHGADQRAERRRSTMPLIDAGDDAGGPTRTALTGRRQHGGDGHRARVSPS